MKENKDIVENINIKNYREFVKIEGHYGAYQNWLFTEKLKGKFWADRACGVAAAGNLAYYLSKNHNKNLYPYSDLTIGIFTRFLNDISNFIKPRVYGIPTVFHMKRGFTRFARSSGVILKAETINMKKANIEIIRFIKRAVEEDYPVMMLTWNSKIPHLKYHWVTITGYFKDSDGRSFIITSNWGRREVFNLDDWLKERSFNKGLIYFK